MSSLSKLFFAASFTFLGKSTLAFSDERYMVIDLKDDYGVSYLAAAPEGGWSDEYKTSKIVLRRIEPGMFDMGDCIHGGPLYKNIQITEPYYIGVFEITQRQWELIQGSRPSFFAEESSYATRPVEMVSYDMIRGPVRGANWPLDNAVDEDSFLGVLRARSGVEFDLPTEAQWEFACRAGTTNDYNNGECCAIYDSMYYYSEDTNLNSTARYYYNGGRIWVDCGVPALGLHDYNSGTAVGTAKVGSYLPNALGIYDMHGNVDEWCRDWFGPLSEGSVDPVGATKSTLRVVRGGDWYYYAERCVSFARDEDGPECVSYKYSTHGFRIVAAVKRLRIKFDMGEEGQSPEDLCVESGCVLGGLPMPERYGYSFFGWFAEAEGGVPYTAESIMPAHDLYLTARWEKRRYTLIFAPGLGVPTEQITREFLDTIGDMPTPAVEGRDFLGWFTSAVGGTQVTAETVVTKDVTFYAHWRRIGSTADEEVIAGEKVTIETGFIGYTASGLPSGLKYDAKTGKIAGAATKVTAKEGVVVKFTKKNAADEEITIAVRAEDVSVGCAGLSGGPIPAGVVGASEGIDLQICSEGGTKSVSVSKLPTGMKYDSKKGVITGAPSKAGDYEVTLTVTTKFGTKETVKIPVSVTAMPVMAVGTFTGFVSVGEDNFGTFTLTTTDAGKLTAKVVTAAGTVSFSGTCWDSVEDGVYRATLTTKKGEMLTLTLDSMAGWDANQLSGAFTTAAIAATKKSAAVPSRTYAVSAQRNAFGKTWYFAATGDETTGWKLAYTEDTKGAALTVTLKADGSTSIAGKLPNGTDTKGKAVTIKVSASGSANVGGLKESAILADFAPVLTVNKVKTVLAITTNLWFDRKNEVGRSVGAARFVK